MYVCNVYCNFLLKILSGAWQQKALLRFCAFEHQQKNELRPLTPCLNQNYQTLYFSETINREIITALSECIITCILQ